MTALVGKCLSTVTGYTKLQIFMMKLQMNKNRFCSGVGRNQFVSAYNVQLKTNIAPWRCFDNQGRAVC